MAIIGFIFLVVLLGYMTFALGFVTLHGGEEFSSIFYRSGFFVKFGFLILWISDIALWWLLVTNSPFTIILTQG